MKLEIISLEKSFGNKKVLSGIDFCAQSGSAFGYLGRNGAGKTTTMRIIMDVFRQDAGKILLDGKPFVRGKHLLGYMPEERGLTPKRVIFEQLLYIALLKGLSKFDAKASINKWCKRFEVEEYLNKKPEELSKGNQQKVQLALTLLGDPKIVVLDEPFSGLDPVNAQLLKSVVRELMENDNLVVFSSHQMSQVEEFCDDIAILNNGKIVLDGNLRKIKKSYDRKKLYLCADYHRYGENCLKILKKIAENAKGAGLISSSEAYGDGIIFELTKEENKDKILTAIANSDFYIERFEILEPKLEDIFIEKTSHFISDETTQAE